jgi:ribose transport system ATP-binding protein
VDRPILSIRDVSKSFGSTRALDRVSIDVGPGEIHALLGQNGSGKSTLIKILSGFHASDDGSVELRGEPLQLPLPAAELRRLGLAFVHQELGLVDTLSVLENVRVGRFETGVGWRIRWRSERARTRALLRRFDLDVDPRTPVGSLGRTERAIVAIIRALDDMRTLAGEGGPDRGGLLVLDEPTASLPEDEVRLLFETMRRVTESGSSVLFVTHRLEEVLAVCDVVSVLRDGRHVATERTRALDEPRLIELILGRPLDALYPDVEHEAAEPVLEVAGLGGATVRDVSFRVRSGEIVGLTGLVGAGYDEVPYLVYGARRATEGVVTIGGDAVGAASPHRARRLGVALLPGDRQRQAGIPRATVKENVTLPVLRRYSRLGRLEHRRERRDVRGVLERFRVRPPDPDRPLASLSGGNQQKALLARWVETRPRVLLLHEPTQGVDVGSRRDIFELLQGAVAGGTAVVYASAEHEDLAHLCDRVLVFRRGRLARELSGAGLTKQSIASACYAAAG